MNKIKKYTIEDRLFLITVVFFIGWAMHAYLTSDNELLFDRLFAAVQVGFVWMIWKKFEIKDLTVGVAAVAIVLHQLKLYGNVYLGLQFDNYMHAVGGLTIALLLYPMIKQSLKPSHTHWLLLSLFTFAAAIGIASMIEPLEYMGYANLGEGEGILFYGAGDGGWRDTAGDLTANMIGALAGVSISFFTGKRLIHSLPEKN